MTTLNDIISVTITREDATIQRASFAIPMFLAAHTNFAARAKSYNSLAEVAADFGSTTNVYKAATAYFSQNRGLKSIVVGRRQVPSVTITPTVADNTVYSFKVDGTLITFTSGSSATAASIVTGLKAALSSASITDPVASGTSTLILTSANGHAITAFTANLSAANASVTETVAETMAAVRAVNDSWYIVNYESHVDADILAMAAYIETVNKKYIFSSQSSGTKTSATNDIFSQLKALGYANTAYVYKSDADTNFFECGYTGYHCPAQPGSNVWCYKTIVGQAADSLTSDEIGYIEGKNGGTYQSIAGKSVVVGGKVAVGEWLD